MTRETKASLRHLLHIEREKRRSLDAVAQANRMARLELGDEVERAHAYIRYADERSHVLNIHDELMSAVLQRAGECVEQWRKESRERELDVVKVYETALEYARRIHNDGTNAGNALTTAYYASLAEEA